MHEVRENNEPSIDELIVRMTPVDLLLVEGFKSHPHPKMEVHRPVVGKPLLQINDPAIIAVASDGKLNDLSVPIFNLNDIVGIADFIIEKG